jgi:membrane protease YdiL (CAAX protease family)
MLFAFLITPLLLAGLVNGPGAWAIPMLCVAGAICGWVLWKDPAFKRFRLWHTQDFLCHIKRQLKAFVPLAIITACAVYTWLPESFLVLPDDSIKVWLYTLAVYPFISVIPQELIFRTFFFHRYKHIVPSKVTRLGISSVSFALAHVIYGNWIAVGLSFLGGLLFGFRYIQTRSTLLVALEHYIWGSFLFTVGLGVYLVKSTSL